MDSNSKNTTLWLVAFLATVIISSPSIAEAASALFNSGTNLLEAVVDLLTNVWARLLAIIAVVFVGIMAMFQRLDWRTVAYVTIGIMLVFGAAAFVDSIQATM